MKMHRLSYPSFWETVMATIISCIGYFSPIKNITHMVLLFFFIDIIYGWLRDRKINKAKFSPRIIWDKTVPRITLTIIILMGSFMLDQNTGQEWVSIYKTLGWFISALLLFSIAKNGYVVTGWNVFRLMRKAVNKKIKDEAGIELEKEEL